MTTQALPALAAVINRLPLAAALAATLVVGCSTSIDDDPLDDGAGDGEAVFDAGGLGACGTLAAGGSIGTGASVRSCKNGYRLTMQADGNLVLYTSASKALWSSRTNGKPGKTAVMQTDGNLVVYTAAHVALWASGTNGHPGSRLAVQDDGNVVIYQSGKAIWATGTVQSGGGGSGGVTRIPGTKLCAKTHDGIPAYGANSSCSSTGQFNVFTDDGIDTATTAINSSWKQSEGGFGYQCVELATRYFFATHNINPFWSGVGVAPDMCASHPAGVSVVTAPTAGDLIVIGPGACGVSASGHVAVIDGISGSTINVTQQNPAGKGSYNKTCARCFLRGH